MSPNFAHTIRIQSLRYLGWLTDKSHIILLNSALNSRYCWERITPPSCLRLVPQGLARYDIGLLFDLGSPVSQVSRWCHNILTLLTDTTMVKSPSCAKKRSPLTPLPRAANIRSIHIVVSTHLQ